ncbi:MAG: CHAD domain-containing protein [Steroidobacteraceae bacterium]
MLLAAHADYLGAFHDCRRKASVAHVHDLRIATRRLRVAISLCEAAGPEDIGRRARRLVRRPFTAAGRLRDVQIAVRMLRQRADSDPATTALRHALEGRCIRRRRRVRGTLERKRAAKLTAVVATLAARLQQSTARPKRRARVEAALTDALRSMRHEFIGAPLSGTRARELHQLRIALKRLRYAMESIAPYVGPPAGTQAAVLAAKLGGWQGELGSITDLDMLLARIRAWRSKHPRRGRPLVALETRLRGERDAQDRHMRQGLRRMRQSGRILSIADA